MCVPGLLAVARACRCGSVCELVRTRGDPHPQAGSPGAHPPPQGAPCLHVKRGQVCLHTDRTHVGTTRLPGSPQHFPGTQLEETQAGTTLGREQ